MLNCQRVYIYILVIDLWPIYRNRFMALSLNGNIIYTYTYLCVSQPAVVVLWGGRAMMMIKVPPAQQYWKHEKNTKVFSFNVSKRWAGGCLMIDVFFFIVEEITGRWVFPANCYSMAIFGFGSEGK